MSRRFLFRATLLAALIALPALAQRHLWLVPGTAGEGFAAIQWDAATGTILAAQGGSILRLDPVTGRRTRLLSAGSLAGVPEGVEPKVQRLALGSDGQLHFTTHHPREDGADGRIWRLAGEGRAQVVAGRIWEDEAPIPEEGKDAREAVFFPDRVAAGPGGQLFVADQESHRVFHLEPWPDGEGFRFRLIAGGDPSSDQDLSDLEEGGVEPDLDPDPLGQAVYAWDLAPRADGSVALTDRWQVSQAVPCLLTPGRGEDGAAWRFSALPDPEAGDAGCAYGPGSGDITLNNSHLVAAGEGGRIYASDFEGHLWEYAPVEEALPGGAGAAPAGQWRVRTIAGPRTFRESSDQWPPQGAAADQVDAQVLSCVRQMVALPGGSLLLCDGRDGIRLLGPESDADLAARVREVRAQADAGEAAGHGSGAQDPLFRLLRQGLEGDPRVADLRAALAVQAARAPEQQPAPPAPGPLDVWPVPNPQGRVFQCARWERGTGTLLAASGGEILRLDPVRGQETVLRRLPLAGAEVLELLPGPDGTFICCLGRPVAGGVTPGAERNTDGRIWSLGQDGRLTVLAGQPGPTPVDGPHPKDRCLTDLILAAGPGGELFMATQYQGQVFRLDPDARTCEPIAGLPWSEVVRAASSDPDGDRPKAAGTLAKALEPQALAVGPGGQLLLGEALRFSLLTPDGEGAGCRWRRDPLPLPGDDGSNRFWSPRGYGHRPGALPYCLAWHPDGTVHVVDRWCQLWSGRAAKVGSGSRWTWRVAGHEGGGPVRNWAAAARPGELPVPPLTTRHLSLLPGGGLLLCDPHGGIRFLGPPERDGLGDLAAAHRQAEARGDWAEAQAILERLVRQVEEPRGRVLDRPFRRLNRAFARDEGLLKARRGLTRDTQRLIATFLVDPAVLTFRAALAVQAIRAGSPFEQARLRAAEAFTALPAPAAGPAVLPAPAAGPTAAPSVKRTRITRPPQPGS